jgi:hypothetical protein
LKSFVAGTTEVIGIRRVPLPVAADHTVAAMTPTHGYPRG